MKLKFYLPTNDEWCGTFDGGYVECTIINEKQPTNITKKSCDWIRHIFIIFQGNDDLMLTKRYQIEEKDYDKETVKALELIANIPIPVTKEFLKTIGFKVELHSLSNIS
jgi:hypothetical protein